MMWTPPATEIGTEIAWNGFKWSYSGGERIGRNAEGFLLVLV